MDGYTGNDNSGNPKTEYLSKLSEMPLSKLREETENKIWLSGYASNNPHSDYHWHVDACYDELKKRTGSDAIYASCYEKVLRSI